MGTGLSFWSSLTPTPPQGGGGEGVRRREGQSTTSTTSAILQLKMRPNQKVEESKPALELNFTLKYKWAGHT